MVASSRRAERLPETREYLLLVSDRRIISERAAIRCSGEIYVREISKKCGKQKVTCLFRGKFRIGRALQR